MKILVVEDNQGMQRMLERTLKKAGYQVVIASRGDAAIDLVRQETFFAVVSDLRLPGGDGLSVLREAKKADERTVTIIITAYGSIEIAVQAMKDGADDFLTKPFDTNLLLLQLKKGHDRYLMRNENTLLRQSISDASVMPHIIGKSKPFIDSLNQVRQVGPLDSTVLLLGESGTGKEVFARAVHALSTRNSRQFVAINCAAIPHDLLENELFGHERGAYTGADRRKPGKLELADGGTVFLDEIGDMDPVLQAKVLRFLQEKRFERVGSNATLSVNVRVIAATNQNLHELVKTGRFREDLYYRLSVFPIVIPPLRDRRDDIPLLVDYFVELLRRDFKKNLTIHTDTMEQLIQYDWPGNVRELQNCLERAAILTLNGLILPVHVAVNPVRDVHPQDLMQLNLEGPMSEVVEKARHVIERQMITNSLKRNNWNKSQTARDLDVNYKTLLTKMKQHGIE
ncbi:sigma-54-dependent Fis family transcriptional regulator [bacterium]|nr:sigma-54-dependent Fis family transcriptional regulator [candidate division CSSED10-310 bacterium]